MYILFVKPASKLTKEKLVSGFIDQKKMNETFLIILICAKEEPAGLELSVLELGESTL